MDRALLTFLVSPALGGLVGLFLVSIAPSQAVEVTGSIPVGKIACVQAPHGNQLLVCPKVATASLGKKVVNLSQKLPEDPNRLEFTDEESDAAIALFGCDCPPCLNALRQLRQPSVGS